MSRSISSRLIVGILLLGWLPGAVSAQPPAPSNLQSTVSGAAVTLSWTPPVGGPYTFRIEAGSGPGLTNVATVVVSVPYASFTAVPVGTYHLRVRTLGMGLVSAPSSEVIVAVAPPGPPANLSASVAETTVTLDWEEPTSGGALERYILEAGSVSGAANLAIVTVSTTSFTATNVPPGVYFVRVKAANGAGIGNPSNELSFAVVALPAPGPPRALSVSVSAASVVTLAWQPPATGGVPTGYRIEAGSAPGLADLAQLLVGSTPSFAVQAPPRVYYVHVRALNATGTSAPTDDVVVNVTGLRNGIPVSGTPVAALAAFDGAITSAMSAKGIGAGSLSISAGSRVLFERGYGWIDRDRTTSLLPDAPFRLASVSKPITAAVVTRLAAAGRLATSDNVFCTGANPPCHLSVTPAGPPDPRLGSITIAHLVAHAGGWDRDFSGDPMFNLLSVALDLGVPSPVSKSDIVRWLAGRTLDFTPGTRTAYSNVGYLVLGQVIEQVTGRPYEAEIHQSVFAPLNVPVSEVYTGRSLPVERDPREPVYEDPYLARSLFPPYGLVPRPDGGLLIEAFEAFGGVVASSRSLALFLSAYWINGEPRAGTGLTWTFYGSMPGTLTMVRQLPNGVNLAVLFNTRRDRSGIEILGEEIRLLLDGVAAQIDWGALDGP